MLGNGDMEDQEKLLSYLRRVTSNLQETRLQLQEAQAARREPIAIVAAACRLPGGVRSPQDLWELVIAARDAITEVPTDRGWDPEAMGGATERGGFLDDALSFDAAFFGISPREALGMDPQQRLLLEVAWEAVERARINPATLRGSRTGVFAGVIDEGYAERLRDSASDVGGYVVTGCTTSVASGRIAYSLGLEGPAVTVDTACSSSLVALHLAVQSLRQGECDLALGGGATVMSTPLPFADFSRQDVLSGDGQCRAFGTNATGIGLAEGVGLLLLERLTDARRQGHPVLALIRGSAVNSDGASNGLTAPNGLSQQRVIRQALENAGLSASQVDLVEAHGTGTRLGDPIEAQALAATYGAARPAGRPLWLGSLKSNVGHTQAAAGVAGVIKAVAAMHHEVLPPTRHVSVPSPLVDWADSSLSLVTEPTPWPPADGPRRAAVSAFGISGTNAHLILEAAGQEAAPEARHGGALGEPEPSVTWPLSGRDETALRAQAARLSEYLAAEQGLRPADVGYALATSRAALAHRAVVLGPDPDELAKGLRAVARGRAARSVVKASGPAVPPGRVAFIFPGQGGQWAGMATELMDGSALFRAQLETCAQALEPYLRWSVIDVLRGEPTAPPLEMPDVIQPALFAMMVSLAGLWRAHGVEPTAVVGHSQGEIAAACVAGALSMEEAARVVSLRSQAAMDMLGQGGLVALSIPEAEARDRLARWGDALSIGVVNSPRSVVAAGPHWALRELLAACEADGVRARSVPAAYASHSPQMDALRERLHEVLGDVTAIPGSMSFYSTVTGEVLEGPRLDAAYWYRNQREPVRFEAATRRLLDDGYRTFIEVSPHPLLVASIEETVEAHAAGGAIAVGTLRRDDGGPGRVRRSMAEAYVKGADIDWGGQLGHAGGRPVDLPTTVFLGERYWPEPGPGHAAATAHGWRYEVGWSPVAMTPAPGSLGGRWLVFVPAGLADGDIARAVMSMFAGQGCDARLLPVTAGEVTAEALAGTEADGVLSLLGLDESPLPGYLHVPAGLSGTQALLRALGELGIGAPLWCGTRGAVSAERSDSLANPGQAAIWGLGRVAALEHPERWGGLVDLPATLDERALARLAAVLAGQSGEDQLALRDSGLFARRLRRAADGAPAALGSWQPAGPVLITGGTGALGGHVARHLARNGARHLVLVSRRGEQAPGAAELAAELQAMGTRVSVTACDVADRDALGALVDGLAAGGTPVRTVVHAAGAPAMVPLAQAGPLDLAGALAGKASGARHLHELFQAGTLDQFVVFSSGSGVWGAGGQGPYAAANAVLDALVEHRRARGLPGTALAWGLWQGDGMAQGETGEQLRRRGMGPMSPARAVAALSDAVTRDEGSVVIADFRWEPFLTGFTSARASRLFEEIPLARQAATAIAAGPTGDGTLAAELRAAGPAELRGLLDDLITATAAAVLNLTEAQAVPAGRAFRELGFDSLTAVEMRNRLVAATGLPLPTTVVFDYPTPTALAVHLREQLGGGTDQGAAPVAPALAAAPDDDPIAIVGMSCRFPGGVRDPEALWRLVDAGQDAIGPFPTDRGWDPDGAAGRYVREGGFLYDAADFDAGFFGLSPREALTMDPQQRLILETSWEALERAGINPQSLRGSQTAVMVGIVSQDYAQMLRDASEADGYRITGGSAAVVSGRVAYFLGLEGQALTVDTACSSSLVAIHLASQALRRGEVTLALAGGATVMASPTPFLEFSKQRGLASDGRCHSFAASADGTGWGEGAGMVVLQRLSHAIREGRDVLAVIRGSALNQDGASNGLTAPSGPAQQDVIRRALAAAGLAARDVDAVEAHGTATTLGDPIEARALIATYGQDRADDRPLWIGSLKSNIGHTQAAAGVGGVIKIVQALRHEMLPPTLHVDAPTPHVDWSAGDVRLLAQPVAWPRGSRPRRAAVSAFGISGTNAHLILEDAPTAVPARPAGLTVTDPAAPMPSSVIPVPVSGQSPAALAAQAARLARYLDGSPGSSLADVAHALCTTRAQLAERAVVLARDRKSLRQALEAIADGRRVPDTVTGTVRDRPKVALLLPGQGSQGIGLGYALRETFAHYAAAFDAVCAQFDRHLDQPLASVLFADPGTPEAALLDQTSYAQPALFAVEVALGRLLEDFGVRPDVLLGHSIGEIAAVYLAGALSLEDSSALVAARGRLMQAQPTGGAMMAIEASEAELRAELAGKERHVSLAAVNGPKSVVVSGDAAPVLELAADWQARGRRIKRLKVSHAFHSPHMEGALAGLGQVAARLTWAPPSAQVISSLTGAPVTAAEMCSAGYWAAHARQAVRFGDGVRWLAGHGVTVAIELGGEGTLSGLVQENLDSQADVPDPLGARLVTVPALRGPRPEVEALMTALAQLHVHGVPVDLSSALRAVGCPPPARPVPLPTTPFQRQRYWLDVQPPAQGGGAAITQGGLDGPRHPVLTAAVPLAEAGGWVFTGRLSPRDHSWLADHAIEGTAVVPGIALLELALRAGRHAGFRRLDEMTFQTPLMLPAEGDVEVQVRIGTPQGQGGCPVTIHSRPGGAARWARNATGQLTQAAPRGDLPELKDWPPSGAEPVPVGELYQRLATRGYTFGQAFRSLRNAWRRGDEWFTEVRLAAGFQADTHRFEVHPALLDSAGHLLLESLSGPDASGRDDVPVLFAVEDVQVDSPGAASLRARLTLRSRHGMEMLLADGSGDPVARVGGLTVRAMPTRLLPTATALPRDALFWLRWSPRPRLDVPPGPPGSLAVVGDGVPVVADASRHADLAALTAMADPSRASLPQTVFVQVAMPGPDSTSGTDGSGGTADAVRAAAHRALALARDFLAAERLAGARLVMITSGAVAVGSGDRLENLPGAAVWGLLRAAQSEHPGRFTVADLDGDPASWQALPAAVASGEPQLALRAGVTWVPGLVSLPPTAPAHSPQLDPAGTVLVTGAGGALGRRVARHLVAARGARRLLLLSRAGHHDRGLAVLAAEIEALGAAATVFACDIADRAALARALAAVPPEHALTGIYHTAGVLADGLLTDLTNEQVDAVLRPKADGALHLLDLTRDCPLAEIVLFSSAAAILGNAGQANYAAANAVLDALAEQARFHGAPIRSLAWGPWDDAEGMAGRLDSGAVARLRRIGLIPLSAAEGLALLDATAGLDTAVVLPMHVDIGVLDAAPASAPGLLRGLSSAAPAASGTPPATAADRAIPGLVPSFRDRLAGLDEESRGQAVLDLVCTLVAQALGHAEAGAIDPWQPFLDLGFNSLMAVELRNELGPASGLRLPVTLVFEFPTPVALARHLLAKLVTNPPASPIPDPVAVPDDQSLVPENAAAVPGDRPRPILALEPM